MSHATITDQQRSVLAKLAPVVAKRCYVGGGIAVTAHFDHRTSRDIDLFFSDDPTDLVVELEQVPGLSVTSRAAGTLHIDVDGLPVSLLRYPYPLLSQPAPVAALPVEVASIEDLAAMKLSAIAGRGAARDFWDLHTIIVEANRPLGDLLDSFRRKYPKHDLGHVLKSLTYFADADAAPLPRGLDRTRWIRICDELRRWVRELALRP